MATGYFYLDETKIINHDEYYTVIKSVSSNMRLADDRAKGYANHIGKKLAGGYFVGSSKPYNFKTHYKVIEIPKGFSYSKKKGMDELDMIMSYESGELSDKDTLILFSNLIKSGRAWQLQGSYGRVAKSLIDNGYISKSGKILKKV